MVNKSVIPGQKEFKLLKLTIMNTTGTEKDDFIEKHLANIWEKTKEAKIDIYIKPLFDSLPAASIKYFLETGTVNGEFRNALNKIMDSIKNWSPPSSLPTIEGEEKAEELWDKYSQLVGSDIDELSYFAGRVLLTREGYNKIIKELLK